MDLPTVAATYLEGRGIHLERVPEAFLRLWTGPGFPELTAAQVVDLARQHGFTLPPA